MTPTTENEPSTNQPYLYAEKSVSFHIAVTSFSSETFSIQNLCIWLVHCTLQIYPHVRENLLPLAYTPCKTIMLSF